MLEQLVAPSPAHVQAGPTQKSQYSRWRGQRQEGHTVAEIVYCLRTLLSIFLKEGLEEGKQRQLQQQA